MITKFEIKNLFNQFDYILFFLNADKSPIKFITGPNGYGKTTILSLINALYGRKLEDYRIFIDVPFSEIIYTFDGMRLKVTKTQKDALETDAIQQVVSFVFSSLDGMYPVTMNLYLNADDIVLENFDSFRVFMQSRTCYYLTDQRIFYKRTDTEDSTNEYDNSVIKNDSQKLVKLLRDFLIDDIDSGSPFGTPREIEQEEYDSVVEKYNHLQEKLNNYKFFTDPRHVEFPAYEKQLSIIFGGIVDKLKIKLEKYRTILDKLDLMSEIIKEHNFVNKVFNIEAKEGFKFWTIQKGEFKDLLPLEKLSSGEKQLLIQAFELIFLAEEGSVVLIDEPETSYHMAWQINYYKTIKKIAEKKNIQCIIATHSPEIFNGNWSKSIDLYECSKVKV